MIKYAGLGYRRGLSHALLQQSELCPAFVELAPENWMGIGGYWRKQLSLIAERYPITAHGLSLSIGSTDPLNVPFLKKTKQFLDEWNIQLYSEHLSFSQHHNAHVYELLPIPFTEEATKHVVARIKQAQDILDRALILEIVSYYTTMPSTMREVDFINTIVQTSGCDLLLDVNNVFVNGHNHGYDPRAFISELDTKRIKYIHLAGHDAGESNLLIDSHTEAISPDVYDLFAFALEKIKAPVPVLLERDGNFPPVASLQSELEIIESICTKAWQPNHV